MKVSSFHYFYHDGRHHIGFPTWPVTCYKAVKHAVIKLFYRSNAIPTATYDEERSLYHGMYYRVETKNFF